MMRRRLGWEIGAVLAAKLVLLVGLYLFFFANRVAHDASAVGAHVVGEGAR